MTTKKTTDRPAEVKPEGPEVKPEGSEVKPEGLPRVPPRVPPRDPHEVNPDGGERIEVICPGCGSEVEDTFHAFWGIVCCDSCWDKATEHVERVRHQLKNGWDQPNRYEDERPATAAYEDAPSSGSYDCGPHAFKPLHKDKEHAILYCPDCGLMRIIEMAYTECGRLPVLDIPTPIALPDDWPKPGDGDAMKTTLRDALAMLEAFKVAVAGSSDGDRPLPRILIELAQDADTFLLE